MIVILTCREDASADWVISKITNKGWDYKRINLDEIRKSGSITIEPNGNCWILDDGQTKLASNEIDVVWQRRVPRRPILHNNETISRYITQEWRLCLDWWLHQFPAEKILDTEFVLKKAGNKMTQLDIASKLGFRVPQTIITSNPDDYAKFVEKHKRVIAKTLGGFGQIIEENKSFGTIFTTRIDRKQHLDPSSLRVVPIILQEEIRKLYELRVTVVDEKLFPCKIESQCSDKTAVDWRRYDFPNVPHSSITLPPEIADRILQYMRYFELHFASFDLAVTPENEYVFFEINPNSQWVWIENYTDLQITDELITALHRRCNL